MDQKLTRELAHEAAIAGITPGSDEYCVARFAVKDEQYRTLCILALKTIIEQIPLKVSDPGIARIKLAWWRDHATSQGHPLVKCAEQLELPLTQLLDACASLSESLDSEYLRESFEDRPARERWFKSSFVDVYQLLGQETQLAIMLEQARSLLKMREEIQANIFRLSSDSLAKAGLEQENFVASPLSTACHEFIVSELTAAESDLAHALTARNRHRSPTRTYAELTLRRLQETIRDGGRLFERKVDLTPIRKMLIAWRCRWL